MSTEIAWTDETWNPTTGCDRVSAGCDHCYAMTLAKRLKAMGQPKYQRDGDPRTSGPGFGLTLHPDALDLPLRWKKPRRVFVDSMSDLFHPDVPDEFIAEVYAVMAATPQHTYQVLTKRPQRMLHYFDCPHSGVPESMAAAFARRELPMPTAALPNVWLGTSVENQRYANLRIPHLLATPAAVRFLSIEPLLGPVDLSRWLPHDLELGHGFTTKVAPIHPDGARIGWVIVGGESGPGARPMEREWAQDIVDQCQAAGVSVFVKQLGTVLGGKHHQVIETFPAGLRVREFPESAPVAVGDETR